MELEKLRHTPDGDPEGDPPDPPDPPDPMLVPQDPPTGGGDPPPGGGGK
jgi:hypothetical protein